MVLLDENIAGGLQANFSNRRAAAFWQAAAAELARPVDLESVESRASNPSGSALAILQPFVAAEILPRARPRPVCRANEIAASGRRCRGLAANELPDH